MNTTHILDDEAIPPPPLSDNGSADGLLGSDNAVITSGKSPLQWAKKNIVIISIAVLMVGTVGFAIAMFRPGGPARSASSIQSNFGTAINTPTYFPTYMPTYMPTYIPTYMPTYTPTVPPTPSPVKPTPALVTVLPTPRPTPAPVELTAYPTTPAPTLVATDSATETVNTEATGPPTFAGTDPVM